MSVLTALVLILSLPGWCHGDEISTRFGTVLFANPEMLQNFNENIRFGKFQNLLGDKKARNLKEEVQYKIEAAVEGTKALLEMFPKDLVFTIILLPTDDAVSHVYREIYSRPADFIAFYSPQKKTVYLSVDSVRLRVFIHELAHVVMDFYFGVAPSVKIHEVLAQYVESNFIEE